MLSDDPVTGLLLSYCDPGAQASQVEVLNAKQPGVVLLRIMGVTVRVVTFPTRVVFVTAGVSVVWLSTMPGGGQWMIQLWFLLEGGRAVAQMQQFLLTSVVDSLTF